MKVVDLNKEQFNKMSKENYYRQIDQQDEDLDEVKHWLKYRGTPNATVYRYLRKNGVVWRVKL